MDLQTVKDFLRIDGEEDISFYVEAAKKYIWEATGTCDEEDTLTQYAICAVTQELYDNRTMTAESQKDRVRHVIRSILAQMKWNLYLSEEGE